MAEGHDGKDQWSGHGPIKRARGGALVESGGVGIGSPSGGPFSTRNYHCHVCGELGHSSQSHEGLSRYLVLSYFGHFPLSYQDLYYRILYDWGHFCERALYRRLVTLRRIGQIKRIAKGVYAKTKSAPSG